MAKINNKLNSITNEDLNFWIKNGFFLIVTFLIISFISISFFYNKTINSENEIFNAKVISVEKFNYYTNEENTQIVICLELLNAKVSNFRSKKFILFNNVNELVVNFKDAYYINTDDDNIKIVKLFVTTSVNNLQNNQIILKQSDYIKIKPVLKKSIFKIQKSVNL